MKNSKIQWCHHTFNPWIGCTKISSGCQHCYAESLELRWGKDLWGPGKERQRTSKANWQQPLKWNREAEKTGERHRVFCASLADAFDNAVPNEWRIELFSLIAECKHLDWLLLTKRPDVAAAFFDWYRTGFETIFGAPYAPNVWLGVSVEDQKRADERIPILRSIPARIRFLSVEPMLGPITLFASESQYHHSDSPKLDWVIVGGESGPHARPMDITWATALQKQCQHAGIAFFMKQLGGHPEKRGELEEFPPQLQVRQFPKPQPL